MSTAQRVIDDIDALVDEQLAAGEAPGGYDYNDPEFPRCRCGCMWNGLRQGICPGSDTEGPLMATGLRFGNWAGEPELPPRRTPDVYSISEAEVIEAVRVFLASWDVFRASLSDMFAAIERQFGALYPEAVQAEAREDGRPALPVAARTPPMWAVDATRTRRRRHL